MSETSTAVGGIIYSPSDFLLTNLSKIVPKLVIQIIDANGVTQFKEEVTLPSNNVRVTNNQIIISFQHRPKTSYCLNTIDIIAIFPDGSSADFLYIMFSEYQPYMEEGVTYTITITVSYSKPVQISVTAPTGTCYGGIPPTSS